MPYPHLLSIVLVWVAFVLGLAFLWWVSSNFTRGTLLAVELLLSWAVIVVVTRWGMERDIRVDFAGAFLKGGSRVLAAFFAPFFIPPPTKLPEPGLAGWLIVVTVILAFIRALDGWCARRAAPTVRVEPCDPKDPDETTKVVVEQLQFRLAA